MKYKHEKASDGTKPMWLLWVLAAVLVVIIGGMLVKYVLPAGGDKAQNNAEENKVSEDNNVPSDEDKAEKDEKTAEEEPALDGDAEVIAKADLLARGYYYDEAIELVSALDGEEAKAKKAEYEGLKAALVPYTGRYYHVFFHSLIIDTELAFDNKGHSAEGYNMWMTTASEFKKMLPLLLENNFVMYDITEMVEIDANGKAVPKQIMLPEGKKPLVISIDDVNYYDYMKTDGFADRLDVDETAEL